MLEVAGFEVLAAGFFHRVALGVELHLCREGVGQVDVEALGETEEEEEHVGEFVFDGLARGGVGELGGALLVGEEAEDLEGLGGFGGEADGEVFGAVELVPVAGFAEGADFGTEVSEFGFGVHGRSRS